MKQLLFIAFLFLFICHMCSCNDNGTGEGRKTTTQEKVLIQNDPIKPLPKTHAAVGIGAWILVSAIGIIGHYRIGRNRKRVLVVGS